MVVSSQQMRAWEQAAMRKGLPGRVLMELAAHAVTQAVRELCPPNGMILVCCGGGNNGGDGLACARQLAMYSQNVHVLLLVPPERLTENALENYRAAANLHIPISVWDKKSALPRCDVIVDALFGTGLSRDIEGKAQTLVTMINQAACPVVAVDIPSGIDADTGAVRGAAVNAAHTVTFQHPKIGHLLYPGRQYCGEVRVAPLAPVSDDVSGVQWLSESDLLRMLPTRAPNSHKGDHGRALLIAGSENMAGAAIMAARAALRTGCGLLTVALPASARNALLSHCPEAMTLPLDESCSASSMHALAEAMRSKTCLAIGPGLGRGEGALRMVMHILRHTEIPILADADALYAIAEDISVLDSMRAPLILTPHAGEMARLCGADAGEIASSPLRCAIDFSKRHNAVVHLKGATSVTAEPGGEATLTTTGNAGLAKGGSGDVLTGIIIGLLAQGLGAYDAARLGALLLGLAADRAKKRTGERGMLASDVIEALPGVISPEVSAAFLGGGKA